MQIFANTRFNLFALLVCCFFALTPEINANHLFGGTMRYEYLSTDTIGRSTYRLTVTIYRNCNDPAPLDNAIAIGIYNNNPNRTINRPKTLTRTSTRNLAVPSGGANCTFASNVCVQEGIYQDTILLAPTNLGFHIIHERCCRSTNIISLTANNGQLYYAFIPPFIPNNSSAVFNDVPIPYICFGDTMVTSAAAIDPDGDSLAYSLVWPFAGGTLANPAPGAQLQFPTIRQVQYSPGYSVNQPFGAGGFATINPQTGLINYMSPNAGSFVIAVEVREFRNGQLMGISRVDRELVVLPCPPNPQPISTTPISGLPFQTGPRSFTINAGDILQFPISYSDPTDSIYITFEGELVQGNTVDLPRPTIPPSAGIGAPVVSNFTWNTICAHARDLPYSLVVRARDNGCPPKTQIEVFSIKVNKSTTIENLFGDTLVCPGAEYTYTHDGNLTNNYQWQVINGAVISQPTNNTIIVRWNFNQSNGSIRLIEIVPSAFCRDTLTLPITIQGALKPDAGNNKAVCNGDSLVLGGTPLTGYSYTWSPSTNLSDSTSPNPVYYANNASTNNLITTYIVSVTNAFGCNTRDTVVVTATPFVDLSLDQNYEFCSGDTILISVPYSNNFAYTWSSIGLQVISSDSSKIRLTGVAIGNNVVQNLALEARQIALPNCVKSANTTVTIKITPEKRAGSNANTCSNDTITLGLPPVIGYSYLWQPSTNLSDSLIANPTFSAQNIGNSINLYEYTVQTNLNGCTNLDTVIVAVEPVPPSIQLNGNFNPCFNSLEGYLIENFDTGNYSWQISGGILIAEINDSIYIQWDTINQGIIEGVFTTLSGCKSLPFSQMVNVNKPIIDSIFGRVAVCPNSSNNQYYVNKVDSIAYFWSVTGGQIIGSNQGDTIIVVWGQSGIGSVSVVATNQFGCTSDLEIIAISITPNLSTPIPSGPTEVCEFSNGIVYQVLANQGSTFNWVITGGTLVSGQGTNLVVVDWGVRNPLGRIRITELSNVGCSYSPTNLNVPIRPRPEQPQILSPDSLCFNELPLIINAVNPQSDSVVSYTWAANNSSITGQGTSQAILDWSIIGNFVISAIPINRFGCEGLAGGKNFKINQIPQVNLNKNITICSGDSITIGIQQQQNIAYNWIPNSLVESPNSSQTRFSFRNLGIADTTITLYLEVTSGLTGCSNKDSTTITIKPQPIIDAGQNVSICATDTILLGTPSVGMQTYIWQPIDHLNNNQIPQPRFQIGNISNVPQVFNYYLRVFNPATQCSWLDTVAVTVNPIPSLLNGLFYSACSNDTIQIGGFANPDYNYRTEDSIGNIISTQPLPLSVSFFNQTRTDTIIGYRVFVNHKNSNINCERSFPIYMQIRPRPISDAGSDNLICTGDTIQVGTIPDTAFSYTWYGGPGLQNKFVSNPLFSELNNSQNQIVTRLIVRTVFDRYQCDAFDTTFVTIAPKPWIDTILGAIEVCELQPFNYQVLPNRNGSVFDWRPFGGGFFGDSTTNQVAVWWQAGFHNLLVTETDSNGCVSMQKNLMVKAIPKPIPGAINGPKVVCKAPNNLGQYKYVKQNSQESWIWLAENGRILGSNISEEVIVEWENTKNNALKLVVTSQSGCLSDTIILPILVDDISPELVSVGTQPDNPQKWLFTINPLIQILNRDNVRLLAVTDTTNTPEIVAITSSVNQNVVVDLPESYFVTPWYATAEASDACFESWKSTWHRPVILSGNIDFDVLTLNWTDYLGWQSNIIYELYDYNNDQPILIERLFRNEFKQFLPNLTQNKWCYRIKAINANDENIVSWSNKICFQLEPFCFIPNVFSPNDDNKNEVFKPSCGRFEKYEFFIYNRLGQLVFETKDPEVGWDGKFKGATQLEGTYVYYIRYVGIQGKSGTFKGTFTLLGN